MELTNTGTHGISTRQYETWLEVFAPYPVDVCMAIVEEMGPTYTSMALVPMGAVRERLEKRHPTKKSKWPAKPGATTTTVNPSRPIRGWWGCDGQWGGDWSESSHAGIVRAYGEMAAYPSLHTEKVEKFRQMAIEKGISALVLDRARDARRQGDWKLNRYIHEVFGGG